MGVFDLPAPLFAWLDNLVSALVPPAGRLVLWGIFGAAASMALYWLISPQRAIKETQAKSLEARRALDSYEGDFAGAWPQMREMLRLSVKQVGIVILPAVIASLPVLCLLVWLSNAYGYHFPPPGTNVEVRSFPERFQARWIAKPVADDPANAVPRLQTPRIELINNQGGVATVIPLPTPIPSIHKYQWWNTLFGNPAGYLPDNSKIDHVEINLPSQEFLSFGPSWLRGWEFLFLTVVLVASIIIKVVFRIK